MKYQEMFEAVKNARTTARNFEFFAGQLAGLLAGHLKSIGKKYSEAEALDSLKRELRDWNMNTHQWKK